MSIGIALASSGRVKLVFVENADACCIAEAKARGGNSAGCSTRRCRPRPSVALAMHSSLHRAVERGEDSRVLYQPIHCLGSGRANGRGGAGALGAPRPRL